ncbi:MAG TPA: hypothetical protein VGH37_21160 [Candidatus Acidoferrum sp.]
MLPTFDAGVFEKVFPGILLRQNGGSCMVKPFITAGVIEVPVSVDQLLDGIRIDALESCRNVRTRADDFRINKELSVGSSENSDISACAQKKADIAAKWLNRNFCGGGFLYCSFNKVASLRKQSTWGYTSCCKSQASCGEELTA